MKHLKDACPVPASGTSDQMVSQCTASKSRQISGRSQCTSKAHTALCRSPGHRCPASSRSRLFSRAGCLCMVSEDLVRCDGHADATMGVKP